MDKEVLDLERRLTSADGAQHLNDISRLYEIAESEDLHIVAEALKTIPRVLAHHRHQCRVATAEDANKTSELQTWLRRHADAYHAVLAQMATSTNPRAQVCAVRLVMSAFQDEVEENRLNGAGAAVGGSVESLPPAASRLSGFVTEVILGSHWTGHVAQCVMGEFVSRYIDVRHYILHRLRACTVEAGNAGMLADGKECADRKAAIPVTKKRRHLATFAVTMRERGVSCEDLFERTLAFLREAPAPEATEVREAETGDGNILAPSGRPARFFLREYKKLFQNAWLQLLSLRAPLKQCKPLLQLLPSDVVPHLSNPLMLADFYIQAFHSGSPEVSVLSLSGLFLLLTKYGLGDPDAIASSCGEYYARLYSLLSTQTLMLKRRVRFQRLLTTSLSSGILPARFAGVFAKKCMRLAVATTEHGTILWLMSLAYSLIQRHHSHCSNLLHRKEQENEEASEDIAAAVTSDIFETVAPMSTAVEQASKSSLWELQLLRNHHVPAIATLAKLFLKPFFKPSARKLDPEDFLDESPMKMYAQALRSGDRQLERAKAKGKDYPLAFRVEDDDLANRIAGWAATMSTSQRKIGTDV
eukprot:TRINITY_DN74669_c0_g1_i1.p1 TRINITY_DN74669_c0_g1~~TRINITY_DN74669_c0_g1_i1.p1  ORF type:complete len:586 (+),score=104.19 TRINITY_DN74669_c0_g1_i1:58-1815(+)